MGKKQSYYRRGRNHGPVLIIVLSTLCMILFMTLFFISAMKQNGTEQKELPPVSESTAEETTDAFAENTSGETAPVPPPETAAPVTSAPDQPTEAVTEAVTSAPAKKDPGPVPSEYDEELLGSVALPEGEAPADYVDRLVFFGDSTTYGMKPYKVFGSRDTKQVWTPTSGTLALFRATTDLIYNPNTGEEQSLADICASVKPEYLIMTLGVNGISFMDEAYFKTEYQNVINIIRENSPDTKLILQSMYPVAKSYADSDSINNQKIQKGNQWIVQIASAYGLPYLNTYYALTDETGYLPESYQNGDGMHLNEAGFAVIMDYVKTHPCVS